MGERWACFISVFVNCESLGQKRDHGEMDHAFATFRVANSTTKSIIILRKSLIWRHCASIGTWRPIYIRFDGARSFLVFIFDLAFLGQEVRK